MPHEMRIVDSEGKSVYFGITEDGDAVIGITDPRAPYPVSARFCTAAGGDTRPESRTIRRFLTSMIEKAFSEYPDSGKVIVDMDPAAALIDEFRAQRNADDVL